MKASEGRRKMEDGREDTFASQRSDLPSSFSPLSLNITEAGPLHQTSPTHQKKHSSPSSMSSPCTLNLLPLTVPRITSEQYSALDSLSHKHGEDMEMRLRVIPRGCVRHIPAGTLFVVFVDPFVHLPGATHFRYLINRDGTIDELAAIFTGVPK